MANSSNVISNGVGTNTHGAYIILLESELKHGEDLSKRPKHWKTGSASIEYEINIPVRIISHVIIT